MYKVEVLLPENREIIENKYAEVLANITASLLTYEQLGYLISELEKHISPKEEK
ncbi:hypothetical protein KM792_14435 [Clostridium tyrobutyricum]|jgi:hypothetical protein|uniref:hypothetical protein n=1 Tax=Clostridium tyrobutyricum TaxID=1519 RepID=UPI0002EB4432|nr:hypothetical protein [Clostridium tyrobutyricum]MBR9648019.1 hypothetical protein [Clostridium tyrobutyricum]MBV4417631.1 hypothetical protein [Clostridium tyrobutyricum]MBV4421237.1 hypothetical protein [Clostridium tyrobutyricum]MBV4421241.1 hypothetical protein [Clostridium tyrobutyricum]MBV4424502.1 hypothetical protein [Clostridium tyrobutyricum]